MASNFPKLPGFVPTHDCTRTDFKKVSHVKQEKLSNAKNQEVPLYALPRPPLKTEVPVKDEKSQSFSQTVHKNHFGEDITEQFEPTFVKLDKQVLRFFGFFKESVVESRLENYRLRKITVYYYLEDNSIAMYEPREANSGAPQGIFLKRQMVLKNDGSSIPIAPYDFRVGEDIEIYGRIVRVYDCDQYTREFFENLGQPQDDPQQSPTDNFAKSTIKHIPVRDPELKDFMEHALGGGRVKPQKQFLDHDRKVLKFYARFDNLPYIIHYFLADDTFEIREVHFPNSGRDQFPLLLKRQKLPRKFEIGQPGQNPKITSYIKAEDIEADRPLHAFGRDFELLGVDLYTQQYYQQNFGKVFELGETEQPRVPSSKGVIVPPHNGFGDEEDSLGYVFKLVPKQPKKDYFKYVDNDHKILRYTAKLNTKVPEDIERRFIVSFYLSDDTVSVFEPANKNSGIVEGKFLERRKYKNVDKNMEFITPTDFPLGGDVKINGYSFKILSCDEYTDNYLKGHLI